MSIGFILDQLCERTVKSWETHREVLMNATFREHESVHLYVVSLEVRKGSYLGFPQYGLGFRDLSDIPVFFTCLFVQESSKCAFP